MDNKEMQYTKHSRKRWKIRNY